MCGRYVNKNTIENIIGFFGSEIKFDESNLLKPSYNTVSYTHLRAHET